MTQPRVLFINGFHRSGTTILTSAVTEAIGGVTTTVEVLARHIPPVAEFLSIAGGDAADRGVDRLAVTPHTAEEYGFLLHYLTGSHALYARPAGLPLLRRHIAELAAEAPGRTVVLKNPWDTGREAQMLADFPDADMIVLRRRLADVERSAGRALLRANASAYAAALRGDDEGYRRMQRHLETPWRRRLLLRGLGLSLRRRAYRLAGSVDQLPIARVAFLSYDELRADPVSGAGWAAHLLDPRALAAAFAEQAFADPGARAPASPVQRALDRRWESAWAQVRARQVQAGVLTNDEMAQVCHAA